MRMKEFLKNHLVLASVFLAEATGVVLGVVMMLARYASFGYGTVMEAIMGCLIAAVLLGTFFIYPAILTVIEIAGLVMGIKSARMLRLGKIFDLIVFVLGTVYTLLYASLSDICFGADWMEQLYNRQVHTPIFTEALPTVIALAVVALTGYAILTYVPIDRLAPLVIVCSMAAMYLGIVECVLWMVQVLTDAGYLLLCLAPFNFILIAAKTIRNKILEWNVKEEAAAEEAAANEGMAEEGTKRGWIAWCNRTLMRSKRWCIAAFLFMLPLLGILICILVLFGQEPDAVIRAWTESSDWNLSLRAAPQNIYYDEHYLCTVAAGGHKKVVKPLRLGVRHGHQVIVNRQLCVANAFEQILEEGTPRLHRHVRHFYDTYGFPVARAIHSPYVADGIYILMKPLEWFFLAVLYFCDAKPENRIAVQYMGNGWVE